jgi:hypothetical protein
LADFDLQVTIGAEVVDWLDEPSGSAQSRLNPAAGALHKNWRARVGVGVIVKAVVGGVVGPADGSLGGRLFSCWFAEKPLGPITTITQPAGHSAVAQLVFMWPGNYLLVFYRPDGGSVGIPIEVIAA